MSEPQGSLIYLMRYLEGHLSVSESRATRLRLDTPAWQAAWERLQLAAVDSTLPITTWEEPDVPAETLAAFLEGTLALPEAARVERNCWDSPELLREFVSTYRFLYVDPPHDREAEEMRPSTAVTNRLLALGPQDGINGSPMPKHKWKTAETGPSCADSALRSDRSLTQSADPYGVERQTTAPAGATPPGVTNSDVAVIVTPTARTRRGRRSRTPAWLVYVATIVIGLGLGLGAVVMIVRSHGTGGGVPERIVTPSDGRKSETPHENLNDAEEDRYAPGLQPPDEDAPPSGPQSFPPSAPTLPRRPSDLVDGGGTTLPSNAPAPQTPSRQRPSPQIATDRSPPQPYRSLAIQWEKIDGLLVARDDDSQPWHGPNAEVHHDAVPNYATLPDSWASAKTNHGRLVLAEDTQVHVNGTRGALQMNITRGRVALSDMPADEQVDLQVGAKSWIIQPIEADTAIGFTVFANQSQLLVRRGRVAVASTEIIAGRQVVLGTSGLGESTPIVASTSWFTRPDKSAKVPAATREALLASRDVRADLDAIWRADDHPAKLFAARWSLAIATDQTLAQALSSPDAKLRLLALNWLLARQPNDPRVNLALRTLARQTGDAQMVRNVLGWWRSARAGTRVTRADADRMVTGLRSDHLAIRQISAFFLENAFGPRVAFDPTAGPLARQAAGREWTLILNRAERAGLLN